MRRRLLILSAAAAACGALAAGTAPAADEFVKNGPAATILKQDSYLRAGQFQKLYATFTPGFKSVCPYGKWVLDAPKVRAQLRGISLKVTGERIQGPRGFVDYQYVRNGKVLAAAKGDLYRKVNGVWLDELDKFTTCS